MWHGFYCHNQPQSEVYGIGFVRLFRDVFCLLHGNFALGNGKFNRLYPLMYGLPYGYGSIPMNAIFGTETHLPSQMLMWTEGLQGFDRSPYLDDYRIQLWLLMISCHLYFPYIYIYTLYIYIHYIYIYIFAIYIYMYMHFPLGRTFTQSLVGGLSLVALGLV